MTTNDTETTPLRRFGRLLASLVAGNTLIAVLLVLSGKSGGFLQVWIFSQIFGCSIGCSCLALGRAWKRGRPWMVILLGSVVGIALAKLIVVLLGIPGVGGYTLGDREAGLRLTGLALLFTMAFVYFFWSRAKLHELEAARKDAELRRTHQENAALVAHLQRLQAQIEPHFLFNTLANLHSLIGTDPARAKALLERLNDHLRASLDHSRSDTRTLGDECRLLGTYLDIQALRMGDRLSWALAVPEELRNLPFPPMLLQPLVENAVIHGIEPKVGAGRIEIDAARASGMLHIRVRDTGAGFPKDEPGNGLGLSNVRERMRALFGEKAELRVHSGNQEDPTGVTAELWIPVPLEP